MGLRFYDFGPVYHFLLPFFNFYNFVFEYFLVVAVGMASVSFFPVVIWCGVFFHFSDFLCFRILSFSIQFFHLFALALRLAFFLFSSLLFCSLFYLIPFSLFFLFFAVSFLPFLFSSFSTRSTNINLLIKIFLEL